MSEQVKNDGVSAWERAPEEGFRGFTVCRALQENGLVCRSVVMRSELEWHYSLFHPGILKFGVLEKILHFKWIDSTKQGVKDEVICTKQTGNVECGKICQRDELAIHYYDVHSGRNDNATNN